MGKMLAPKFDVSIFNITGDEINEILTAYNRCWSEIEDLRDALGKVVKVCYPIQPDSVVSALKIAKAALKKSRLKRATTGKKLG